MIIDINNSIGKRRVKGVRSPEDLLKEMKEASVDIAVVSCFSELIDNDYVESAVNKYPDRLIGLYTVNPWDTKAEDNLEAGLAKGFKGLRLDPIRHGFPVDYIELLSPLFKICEGYGVPVWIYGTADAFSSPILFKDIAETFPKVPVIIGYMGFNYEGSSAISMAKKYQNVYLDPTAAMNQKLMRALGSVGPSKLLLGSGTPDASYFHLEIEKFKSAINNKEALEMVLCDNARRLFNI